MKDETQHKTDDLFKEHFGQTEVSVENEDALWMAIEQQRKPKRRLLIWWFLGIGVLLSGLVWWLTITSLEVVEEKEIQNVEPIAIQEIKGQGITKNQDSSIEEQTLMHSKITGKTPVKHSILNNISVESPFLKLGQNSNAQFSKDISEKQVLENPLAEKDLSSTIGKVQKSQLSKNSSSLSQKRAMMEGLSSLDVPSLDSILVEESPLKLNLLDVLANKSKWDKCQVKGSGNVFVKGYGQASGALEELSSSESIEESPTYIEDWQERFSPFLSYQGGFQVGYQFPWKGYISGGLAYQHFQTKFESTQRVVEQITIYDEMAYFYIDENEETVWVADSVRITNINDITKTHPNNHQLWHIPIQLGYTSTKGNLCIGGNMEALFNISKNYQGYFMNPNRSIVEIYSKDDKNYMSTNLGLSISLGLHLGYRLTDHWEAYISPRFRFNNTSFLDKNQTLKLTRNFVGLRGGMQYHF